MDKQYLDKLGETFLNKLNQYEDILGKGVITDLIMTKFWESVVKTSAEYGHIWKNEPTSYEGTPFGLGE